MTKKCEGCSLNPCSLRALPRRPPLGSLFNHHLLSRPFSTLGSCYLTPPVILGTGIDLAVPLSIRPTSIRLACSARRLALGGGELDVLGDGGAGLLGAKGDLASLGEDAEVEVEDADVAIAADAGGREAEVGIDGDVAVEG